MDIRRGKHGAYLREFYAKIGYGTYRRDFVAPPLKAKYRGDALTRECRHHISWLFRVKPPPAFSFG